MVNEPFTLVNPIQGMDEIFRVESDKRFDSSLRIRALQKAQEAACLRVAQNVGKCETLAAFSLRIPVRRYPKELSGI